MSFENKVKSILESQTLFTAEKRVAILKAMAEEKCRISPKRKRKLGEDLAERKRRKCVNKKVSELWWKFLRQREPVEVGDLTISLSDNEIKVEKKMGV